ncbi:DUF692 domain-containing protein [Siculibacillus lacustris]|uniref:DUF692 domain-containing protein n=1 Tax=Siculibacillus lacustris TaxID=1549641 RepID=A0A4Q9VUQ5_9HYPH|nr:DUF692 domain-containing protein [Siculibacillus lacustris]TBW38758.1 DUF692 domain-containing protein [Siculibacillus lacustris]
MISTPTASGSPIVTLPAVAGVGLNPAHVAEILAGGTPVGFFEVLAENYMGAGGPPHRRLTAIRERFPLSVHGVGLSIGGAEPLDRDHLARLACLVARYQPAAVSEHLGWSSHDGRHLGEPLPLPYTEETLARVVERVDEVQTALGRPILLENPASYLRFAASTIPEVDFLAAVAERSGCGLLLDVANLDVSATNLGFDAAAAIDAFPMRHVGEIHLAGRFETVDEAGQPLFVAAHDGPVPESVWSLWERALARSGPIPTVIEWDAELPGWTIVAAEAARAERRLAALRRARGTADAAA